MKVHLHTLCWNDVKMLDFFFRHFEPWVDRFYILDDHSTDGSREYLEARSDVVVEDLVRVDPDSWVRSARHIYNHQWKQSIGKADWVVVTNIDEHLHHPQMSDYLTTSFAAGITVIPALGYQMITDAFPPPHDVLWRDHPFGAPWINMSKAGIFRPDQIVETNYALGRHKADFRGNIVVPARDEVLNLHYKYLGTGYTRNRHRELGARLGPMDRAKGWGHKYLWEDERLQADIQQFAAALIHIEETDHHSTHPCPRWWRNS